MEDLVSLAETMQQASSLLAGGDTSAEDGSSPTHFLQVVALGSLGSGKSAILNTLIGHPILPTAEGGATRFPMIVDLHRDSSVSQGFIRGTLGDKQLQSAAEIRKAIQADMKRWLPSSSKGHEAIHLAIRSAEAAPLRVVDLPGLEARQSEHDDMVKDYTAGRDAIILVVLPASEIREPAAGRTLRVAQDIDREGSRTVGVITMVDQAAESKATLAAVIELLTGQGAGLSQDFPWVAVIGQPPSGGGGGGAGGGESLEPAWRTEAATLSSILRTAGGRGLEASLGRTGLVRVLGRQIRKHMKERIPKIQEGLEDRQQEVEDELLRLGKSLLSTLEGSRALALELCRGFDTKFVENIEGGEAGGAQMVEKFVGALPGRFNGLPLDRLFSIDNVKRTCLEADGYQPYLLSPEKGLRLLVKRSLDLAKQPGLQCVDEVHKILLDVTAAAGNSAPSLIRFPPLKRQLVAIASTHLDEYRSQARLLINQLVDMERVFIPPAHFIDAANRRAERLRREDEMQRMRNAPRTVAGSQGAATPPPPGGDDVKQPGRMAAALNSIRGRKEPPPPPPEPLKELAGFLWKVGSKGGWTKRWFALSDKTARLYYVKKPDETKPRGVIPLDECNVEDIVSPDEFPKITPTAGDPLRGSAAQSADAMNALVFKLTNKVAYKTVVKVHHNLILRADTPDRKSVV